MRINFSRIPLLIFFSSIALTITFAASSTQAQLILELTSGSNSVTVTDGSAQDSLLSTGELAFNGLVGDVDASFSVGVSSSPGQNGTVAFLSQTSLVVENTGQVPTSLTVNFSDSDFFGVSPGILISDLSLSQVNSTVDNVSFTSFADSSNTSFGQETATSTLQLSENGGLTSSTNFDSSGLFSLSSALEISFAGPGVVTLTGNTTVLGRVDPVPEPSTFGLLASLGSLLLVSRRKR